MAKWRNGLAQFFVKLDITNFNSKRVKYHNRAHAHTIFLQNFITYVATWKFTTAHDFSGVSYLFYL